MSLHHLLGFYHNTICLSFSSHLIIITPSKQNSLTQIYLYSSSMSQTPAICIYLALETTIWLQIHHLRSQGLWNVKRFSWTYLLIIWMEISTSSISRHDIIIYFHSPISSITTLQKQNWFYSNLLPCPFSWYLTHSIVIHHTIKVT